MIIYIDRVFDFFEEIGVNIVWRGECRDIFQIEKRFIFDMRVVGQKFFSKADRFASSLCKADAIFLHYFQDTMGVEDVLQVFFIRDRLI